MTTLTITQQHGPPVEVDGELVDDTDGLLAVNVAATAVDEDDQSMEAWGITHVPTGLSISCGYLFATADGAHSAAAAFWRLLSPEQRAAIADAREAFTTTGESIRDAHAQTIEQASDFTLLVPSSSARLKPHAEIVLEPIVD